MLTDEIHNLISCHIWQARFPKVKFDGRPTKRYTSSAETLKPKTVLVIDESLNFVDNQRSRPCGDIMSTEPSTSLYQERSEWQWQAVVHFDHQVDLTSFENGLLENPLFIPRSETESGEQVTVRLLERLQELPVQRQASHGTRVTYRFQADLSPR